MTTYRYLVPIDKSFRVFAGLSAGIAHVSYEVTTVDRNVVVASGIASQPIFSGFGATIIDMASLRSGSGSSQSFWDQFSTLSTYNPSDGTLTQHFSGSNTVAAGGPQVGFGYDWDFHSTIVLSAKWLYMGKTDVAKASGVTFVQASYRYAF